MENYRRSYGQEGFVRRSYSNRKPPLGIPAWEKKFCKTVGSLNWNAFLEKKKYVHMYDNILEWNDSAGEEAFHSAKRRFWAELNGCTCAEDIPDPDLYIDEIDWECQIDEELLLDLDCRAVTVSDEKRDPVIIFGDSFIQNMPFFSNGWGTGWGEEMPKATEWGDEMPKATGWEEEMPKATGWGDEMPKATGWEEEMPKATGWGDEMPNATGWGDEMPKATGLEEEMPKATGWGYEEDIPKDHGNQWAAGWGGEEDIPKDHDKENRAGDYPTNSWHLNKGDGWSSGWGTSQGMKREADFNSPKNRNSDYGGSWRRWDNDEAARTRAGMSQNRSPRFHGEGHNSNSSWKGRNQENYSWRQKNTGKIQPKGCWNSNACRPNTHQASVNAGQRWN